MIKPILQYPDPILLTPSKPLEKTDSIDTINVLLTDLYDTANSIECVGLAAPQIGINLQVFYIKKGFLRKNSDIFIINPIIINESREHSIIQEGCQSLDEVYIKERPTNINVKYYTDFYDIRASFKPFNITLTGFPARVFLHEFDHLQGVLINGQ